MPSATTTRSSTPNAKRSPVTARDARGEPLTDLKYETTVTRDAKGVLGEIVKELSGTTAGVH